ncbi:MAG: D-alanine--D-alanine ligase [Acidobacteria bacterium]|nr:D-alanine--D-alanine ligase [Acidobacteriota bacterium]
MRSRVVSTSVCWGILPVVRKMRIGVLYGGRSSEHEISLASAAAVMANFDRARYEPIPIFIDRDGRWTLTDRLPTPVSAADVIARVKSAGGRAGRSGREVHLVPHPTEETLLTIERTPSPPAGRENACVTGVALDVIFPVLHGPHGEDGTIQGLLELANVPYVGAGVLASAVGMDKAVMKQVFAARGLPVVDHLVTRADEWAAGADSVVAASEARLAYPVFVKPVNLGSSVGISKVKGGAELAPAIACALQFSRKVIIEAAVPQARDIEVSIIGNDDPQASVAGEILPAREFYDYEAKYLDQGSSLRIPAPLPDAMAARIRSLAVEAYRTIDAAGFARVDFLVSGGTGTIYVSEINTIPGFTTISMFPKLWAATGLDFPALLDRLVDLALERHAAKQRLQTSVT